MAIIGIATRSETIVTARSWSLFRSRGDPLAQPLVDAPLDPLDERLDQLGLELLTELAARLDRGAELLRRDDSLVGHARIVPT